jgi:uncharacterized protein YbaP (TraB family)
VKRSLILATLAVLACATPAPRAPLPACAQGTAGVPLAYELRAPDGRSAFLQGSVHFAREAEAELDPRAKQALHDAKILVGELDVADLSPLQMGQMLLAMGRLPKGQRLQDVLSPETWSLLQERAKATGTPLGPFEQLEPWVVALSFLGVSLSEAGYTAEEGVELQVYGGERPHETRGLESLQDQLSLFASLSLPQQEAMLRDALRPSEENALDLEAMFSAWRCGDAAGLEKVLSGMVDADPELQPFYEATIFRRNRRMADGVEKVLAESDRAFIVVGALHLVGARGIPALLQQAGYQVDQVRAEAPSEPAAAEPAAASP